MKGLLYPNNWVVQITTAGRNTYMGNDGKVNKDVMEITTKKLMTRVQAEIEADRVPNARPFDVDKHLLEGAE